MKPIRYYGWTGHTNFGDDVCKEIIKTLKFTFNKKSDTMLFGGGTLLPLHPNQNLYKENIGDLEPKRKIILGSGVLGKNDAAKITAKKLVSYDDELSFTKKYFKDCKHIGLRDEESRKILGMGEVIGDPLFWVKINRSIYKKEIPEYAVLNMGFSEGNVIGDVSAQLNYAKEVLKFTKKFVIGKLGLKVAVLPLQNYDIPFNNMATVYLGQDNILKFEIKNKISQILETMTHAKFAITYKQHGMIAAIASNIPVIPMAYSKKTINVAKEFKLENHIIPLNKVSEKTLEEKYHALKDWPYKRIENKKEEYRKNTFNFIKKINNDFK